MLCGSVISQSFFATLFNSDVLQQLLPRGTQQTQQDTQTYTTRYRVLSTHRVFLSCPGMRRPERPASLCLSACRYRSMSKHNRITHNTHTCVHVPTPSCFHNSIHHTLTLSPWHIPSSSPWSTSLFRSQLQTATRIIIQAQYDASRCFVGDGCRHTQTSAAISTN